MTAAISLPPLHTITDSQAMSAKRKHGVMDNEGNQPSPATNGIDNDLSQIHEWLQDVLVILKR